MVIAAQVVPLLDVARAVHLGRICGIHAIGGQPDLQAVCHREGLSFGVACAESRPKRQGEGEACYLFSSIFHDVLVLRR